MKLTIAVFLASASVAMAEQRPVEFVCNTVEAVTDTKWVDMYDTGFVMPIGCRTLGGVPDNIAELLELDEDTGVASIRLVTTDWRYFTQWK